MYKLIILFAVLMQVSSVLMADPTKPPAWLGKNIPTASQQSPAKNYQLQQILISEQRRLAIINGELVSEGQNIANARVVKISFDKVVLRVGGQNKTLKLAPETKEVINAQ